MKSLLLLLLLACPVVLWAQWTPVNSGLTGTSVTSMFSYADTLIVGTAGNGIFKSTNFGDAWTDISGNLGNKHINDIRGGGGSRVIWVATENGLFYTQDHLNYAENTATGLTSNDVNYYWFGGDNETSAEWAVGTNGSGLFTSQELNGPWSASSSGLTGNALVINDLSGFKIDDTDYAVLATDGGIFLSTDNLASWLPHNSGLTGNALLAKRLAGLGSAVFAATRAGLFFSLKAGDWSPLIANEKLNTMLILPTPVAPNQLLGLAFGEKGFISLDLMTWNPVDLTGISGGEVTTVTWNRENPTYVWVGTQTGGIFRRSLAELTATGPTADFSATPTSGLAPLTVQFADQSSGTLALALGKSLDDFAAARQTTAAMTSWAWDFDSDGTIDTTVQNPQHTFQEPGNYTVSLTVSDGTNSNKKVRPDFISVSRLTADFSATPTNGVAPLTVEFTDLSVAENTTITTRAWDFNNDGTTDTTAQNPVYTFQQPGSYTVTLTVGDGTNTQTKSGTITVNPATPELSADFSATPLSGLAPLVVQFNDLSTASGTTISAWAWDFDGDSTVDTTAQNPQYTFQQPGNFTVSLAVSDGSIADTLIQPDLIQVRQLTARFSITPAGGFAPLTVQFHDSSIAENTQIAAWAWDFDSDGITDTTVQNPAYTFQQPGTYSVSLKISDGTYTHSTIRFEAVKVAELVYQDTLSVTPDYSFPARENPADFKTTDYVLFGLPGNSGFLLDSVMTSPHPEKWQAYADNGAAENFLTAFDGSENFRLTLGKAFWLIHNGPLELDLNLAASPLDITQNANLPLHTGWNLITNPFNEPVAWSAIQSANNLTEPLYAYQSGYVLADSLHPFQGYYFFNSANLTILSVPFFATLGKMTAKNPEIPHLFSLRIQLTATDFPTGEILLGTNPNAIAGPDRYDFRKPRALSGCPEIYFPRPEWDAQYSSYYSDIRPEICSQEEWKFQITGGLGKSILLKFDVLTAGLPDSANISLVDWSAKKWFDLKQQPHYSFLGNSDPMTFSVRVGQDAELNRELAALAPATFALSQNYPNPFNQETLLMISAPKSAKVELAVFNVLGQRVRCLFSGTVVPGYNTVKWDGLNDWGVSVPSGVYWVTLTTAGNQQSSKKIVLMK